MLQDLGIVNVPFFLLIFVVLLMIVPALIAIFMRFLYYNRLRTVEKQTEALFNEQPTQGSYDPIIAEVEDAFEKSDQEDPDNINTVALINQVFDKETLPVFGVRLGWAEYTTQTFPSILLFLGTVGLLLGMAGNLFLVRTSENALQVEGTMGLGVAFLAGFSGFILSLILIGINFFYDTNSVKERVYTSLLLHLENLSAKKKQLEDV
jgi:hypothetical protein